MLRSVFSINRAAEVSRLITRRLIYHRALLIEQVKQELRQPHARHAMGGWWLLIHPIFLMGVYVFVFAVVFRARIGGSYELPLDYTTYILSGVVPWLAVQQALSKSTTSLMENTSLIKQVVFPIEVIPAKSALAILAPFLTMLGVIIAYVLIMYGYLHWTYALLPFAIIVMTMWFIGISMLLSSITVFVRDVREVIQLYSTAGLFILPIIYLPEWVPPIFKPILYINPISYVIWFFQDILYFGRVEHPLAWFVFVGGGVLVYALGARLFHGLRPYLGDVI